MVWWVAVPRGKQNGWVCPRREMSTLRGSPREVLFHQDKYHRIRFGLEIPQTRVMTLDDAKRIDRSAYAVEHHLIPFWSCRYLIDFFEFMQSQMSHGRRAGFRMRSLLHFDVAAVGPNHWCRGYIQQRNSDFTALFSSDELAATVPWVKQGYVPDIWDKERAPLFEAPYPKPTLAETNRILQTLTGVSPVGNIIRVWEAREKARAFICPIYMPMIKISTPSGHYVVDGTSITQGRRQAQTKLGMELPEHKSLGMLMVDPANDDLSSELGAYQVPEEARVPIGDMVADAQARETFGHGNWEDPNIYPLDPGIEGQTVDFNNTPPFTHNYGSTEIFLDRTLRGHDLLWPSYFPVKAPSIDAELQARRLARLNAPTAATPAAPATKAPGRTASRATARSADFERRQQLAAERQAHEKRRAAEHLKRLGAGGRNAVTTPHRPIVRSSVPDARGFYAVLDIHPTSHFIQSEHEAIINRRIQLKWRSAVAPHHPDRGGDASKATELNEAYSHLKNLKERLEYYRSKG